MIADGCQVAVELCLHGFQRTSFKILLTGRVSRSHHKAMTRNTRRATSKHESNIKQLYHC